MALLLFKALSCVSSRPPPYPPTSPAAVILDLRHVMLFQTLVQKCFTLHAGAFMCNLMNRSNSSTECTTSDSWGS